MVILPFKGFVIGDMGILCIFEFGFAFLGIHWEFNIPLLTFLTSTFRINS